MHSTASIQREVYSKKLPRISFFKRFYSEFVFSASDAIQNHKSLFSKYIRKEYKTVLDVGTGAGGYIPILKNYSECLYCTDLTHTLLCKINTLINKFRLQRIYLSVSRAENLPFKENTFDLCFVMEAVHHFEDTRVFFRELYRVLKPDGKFVFIEPNAFSLPSIIVGLLRREERNIFYNQPNILINNLRLSNFQEVAIHHSNEFVIHSKNIIFDLINFIFTGKISIRLIIIGKK